MSNMESNTLDLEIGAPVFIMSKTDGVIYPGIVYKQTIQKSMKGETSIWAIMVGPREKRKTITTENLEDFVVYKSIFELKEALFRQIMSSIETSIKDATTNLKVWYEDEIPLPILAKALQHTPTKQATKFKEANNLSFAELAGKEASEAIYQQATNEIKKKRPGRKPKKIEFEEQLPLSEEVQEESVGDEEEEARQEPIQQSTPGEPQIRRIAIKDPDGNVKYIDADQINSIEDINF